MKLIVRRTNLDRLGDSQLLEEYCWTFRIITPHTMISRYSRRCRDAKLPYGNAKGERVSTLNCGLNEGHQPLFASSVLEEVGNLTDRNRRFIFSATLKRLLQSVIFLILLANLTPVNAQVTQPVNKVVPNTQNRLAQLKFPRNGAPIGRRQGGARRTGTECPDLKTPLTALVPGEETSDESKSFLAYTVSEYPTFWVYVPQLPSNIRSGEFVFQDDLGKDIYRTPLTLPEKSGVIGISLPQSQQYALKTNNKYQWYFKVNCGERQTTSEYFYVKAWVQRVPLTSQLESQLKAAKPREYNAYAVNNIWQDAVTNLADLRQSNSSVGTTPSEYRVLNEDWTNLLTAVGLSKFASAPIVGHVVEVVK